MHELESLIEEHRLITRLITALAEYAERTRREAFVEREDLANFTRFFKDFADGVHHEKEENILLPLLTRGGASWDHGVLAEVRREHRQERYLIEVLCYACERSGAWTKEDRRMVASTAFELVEFQRAHLRKENEGLFPEVLRRLDPAGRQQLATELRRFDAAPRRREQLRELATLAEELIARYVPGGAAVFAQP